MSFGFRYGLGRGEKGSPFNESPTTPPTAGFEYAIDANSEYANDETPEYAEASTT